MKMVRVACMVVIAMHCSLVFEPSSWVITILLLFLIIQQSDVNQLSRRAATLKMDAQVCCWQLCLCSIVFAYS